MEITHQNDVLRQKQKEFTREKLLQKHIEGKKLMDYHQNINKSQVKIKISMKKPRFFTQIDEKVFHLKRNFLNTHQLSLPTSFNRTNLVIFL